MPERGRPPVVVPPRGGTPPAESEQQAQDRVVSALGGSRGGTIIVQPRGQAYPGTTQRPGPFGDPNQPPTEDVGPTPDDPEHTSTDSQRSRTFTFGALSQVIPMNYGRTEAGGDVFFAKTVNEALYLGINFSQGEIGGYVRELIDGKTLSELGIVRVNRYTGTASQTTPPTLLAEAGYTGIHNRRAFIEFVAERQSEALSAIDPKNMRVLADWIKVRDWSQDPTLVTRYISDNPVWCLADAMTRRHPDFKWGLGCTDSMINWGTTWADAAAACGVVVATGPAAPGSAPTVVEHEVPGGLFPVTNGYRYVQVNRKADGSRSVAGPESTPFIPTRDFSSALVTLVAGSTGTVVRELYRNAQNQPSGLGSGPLRKVLETSADPTTSVQLHDTKQDWEMTLVEPTTASSKRFRIGASINRKMGAREMIEQFCAIMAATVVWQGGKFDIYVDGTQAHTGLVFSENRITTELRLRQKGRGEIPARVLVGYTDSDNDYRGAQTKWPDPDDEAIDDLQGTIGAKPRVEWTMDLPWCPSKDCATRIAAWAYARGNIADFELTWRTKQVGLEVLPIASIVDVEVLSMGFAAREIKLLKVERLRGSLEYLLVGETPITLNDTFRWKEMKPRPPLTPPNIPPEESTIQVLRFLTWMRSPDIEVPG